MLTTKSFLLRAKSAPVLAGQDQAADLLTAMASPKSIQSIKKFLVSLKEPSKSFLEAYAAAGKRPKLSKFFDVKTLDKTINPVTSGVSNAIKAMVEGSNAKIKVLKTYPLYADEPYGVLKAVSFSHLTGGKGADPAAKKYALEFSWNVVIVFQEKGKPLPEPMVAITITIDRKKYFRYVTPLSEFNPAEYTKKMKQGVDYFQKFGFKQTF